MRILHIATLVTPDGAYGGPIRVAVNQAKALIDEGHEVVIYAGQSGFSDAPPTEIDGVPVELFAVRQLIPGTGFAGLIAPGLFLRLLKTVASFDVVHIHLARDLVTLPAAELVRSSKKRYVAQPHGMIDESEKRLARILDSLSTRRVLRSALRVFWLTPVEERSLRQVMKRGAANLVNIRNGVPAAERKISGHGANEVLFLSRLHRRKRPALFVRAAVDILQRQADWSFALVGPDEGEGSNVQDVIADGLHTDRIRWEGSLAPDRTLDRMLQSSIYVLPSVDEPFPMSVLEALSVGLPVIVTNTCGLAKDIELNACGIVVDSSFGALVGAVERLIVDQALREDMSARAIRLMEEQFSMDAVARDLHRMYTART